MPTTKVFRDVLGSVINIGEWDYGPPLMDLTDPENPVPIIDQWGNLVVPNPIPDGATEADEEIIIDADGSRRVVSDHSAFPSLSARQLRLGLIAANILPSQVQAVIDALPEGEDREKAKVEWEYAGSFERSHPLISTVGSALSLTPEQIDSLWLSAAEA